MATKKAPAKKAVAKKAPAKKATAKETGTLPPPNSAAHKAMVLRGEIKE
jgi:hypothetical protein